MTLSEIKTLVEDNSPIFPHDVVDLNDADFAEAMTLTCREAFNREVSKIESGYTCDLTGMEIEGLSRDQAVGYVIAEWRQTFRRFVKNASPKTPFPEAVGASITE